MCKVAEYLQGMMFECSNRAKKNKHLEGHTALHTTANIVFFLSTYWCIGHNELTYKVRETIKLMTFIRKKFHKTTMFNINYVVAVF